MVWSILLSGGVGRRLWPLSNNHTPKQFLSFRDDGKTFFEQTVARARAFAILEEMLVVTSSSFSSRIQSMLAPKHKTTLLCEPLPKNTAAAIVLAALHIRHIAGDGVMWVMPTDHHITKTEVLYAAVKQAIPLAEAGKIVTFGIRPTRPDPNYGYMVVAGKTKNQPVNVISFVEKPDSKTLLPLYHAGQCFWNSGMFVMTAKTLLSQIRCFDAELYNVVKTAYDNRKKQGRVFTVAERYCEAITPLPIDKAVMEKSDVLMTIPVDMGWSDIGSWQSLWELTATDETKKFDCRSCVDFMHKRYGLGG